jgi:hypothetical protein
MAENGRGFDWSHKSEQAAILLAEGKKADEQIAEQCGIGTRTLYRWKDHSDFKARVQKHLDAFRDAVMTQGIADKMKRVERLNRHWNSLQDVIEARAADAVVYKAENGSEQAPGMLTGLVVRVETPVKNGVKIEYMVDTGTLAEIRTMEAAAARELGQLTEKHEVEVRNTGIAEALDSKLVSLAARIGASAVPSGPVEG